MVGAFVGCNGVLDRALFTNPTCRGNPGASLCHIAPPHRAGAWRPTRWINRDLSCPTLARRGPAQARCERRAFLRWRPRCHPCAHSRAPCPRASSTRYRTDDATPHSPRAPL